MATLRGPDGCPWDREQDHRSLRAHLLEEAYEVLAILDRPGPLDDGQLVQELGDLLLQVVFHAQLAAERRSFDLNEVASSISDKLIRRHPHVFGERQVSGAEEVLHNWEQLKLEEGQDSALEGIPASLPALLRASRILSKAERSGFVWSSPDEARAKVSEEWRELEAEVATGGEGGGTPSGRAAAHEELGDLLLALVSYAHFLQLEPESALREAADRFDHRFRRVERMIGEGGRSVTDLAPSELLEIWNQAAEGSED